LRDVAVLQLVVLLDRAGLGNVRPCAAPDCKRIVVKRYRGGLAHRSALRGNSALSAANAIGSENDSAVAVRAGSEDHGRVFGSTMLARRGALGVKPRF
jgi:hypothetical protein